MNITRRKFFAKTQHQRHKPTVKGRSSGAPTVSAPPPDVVPPAPSHRRRESPKFSWLTAFKLLVAAAIAGYGIYFLATSEAGRDIYATPKAPPPTDLPSYPGHRPSTSAARGTGSYVEHSLADRAPPTDQSFVATFGGSRDMGQGRQGPDSGGSGSASAPGELPDKIKLRENLEGNCDIGSGSKGSLDIANCLRRHSAPGK